jgi:hypothetical protein
MKTLKRESKKIKEGTGPTSPVLFIYSQIGESSDKIE